LTKKTEPVEEKKIEAPAPSGVAVLVWGLLMFAACRAIEIFLEAQSMAGAVGQAVLVEWGSSRLGVHWTRPGSGSAMTTSLIAKRAAIGFAIGLGVAASLFLVLLASNGAVTQSVKQVELSVVAIGLATAAIMAWRDELLFHGVVLRALEGKDKDVVHPLVKVLACGATSAGAAIGRPDATAKTIMAATLLGVIFGALWIRDQGAWQPWAANTGFRYATGTLLSGGIVHHRLANNTWAGGDLGMLGGTASTVAFAPLAILALVVTIRMSANIATKDPNQIGSR
jgi:hypothetical protein